MTRLLVSTICRHTPHPQPSGFLYLIDAERQTVLQQCRMIEPAFRELDKNPRGGMRGVRGISLYGNQVAIANASVIFRYDQRWNLMGIISHPVMAAIHDVLYQPAVGTGLPTLWAASARNDLLLQFDLDGNLLRHVYLREPSPATRDLRWRPECLLPSDAFQSCPIEFRDPSTHEEDTYDKAHVNSMCLLPDGRLLASMGLVLNLSFSSLLRIKTHLVRAGLWPTLLRINRKLRSGLHMKTNSHSDLVFQPARAKSAVVELRQDGSHRLALALEGVTVPSHSLLPDHDGKSVLYLNTTAGEVVHFNPRDGAIYSATRVTDGFLRGATWLPDGRLMLGSRNFLLVFDPASRRVVSSLQIAANPNEAVYDIKVLPESYSAPPLSFPEHFQRSTGFPVEELPQRGYRLAAAA